MNDLEVLFVSWKRNGDLTPKQMKELYSHAPEYYDYENHRQNSKIATILGSRNARSDLSFLLSCFDDEICFYGEDDTDPKYKYMYDGLFITNMKTHEILNGKVVDLKRYRNYKPKKEKIKPEAAFEKLKKRCILPGYAKRPYEPVKKEVDKEKVKSTIREAITTFVVAGAVVALVAVTIITGDDERRIREFVNDNFYIVSDNTLRTDDLAHHFYLHNSIAKKILDSDQDTEALIYAVYDIVKRDVGNDESLIKNNMNLIMHGMNMYSERYNYETFDEYLIEKSFVDKDGKANYDKYTSEMKKYISEMLKNNEISFKGGKMF